MRVLVLAIAALSCWGMGCSRGGAYVPATQYRSSDAPLFDHSVDFVEAPVTIEGGYSGTFERRVARADLVAAVRAVSSVAETMKRSSALRITVRVDERFKGESSRQIELRVDDDQASYSTVEDSEERILRDPWIAFIKWESVEGRSDLVPHWHLSPDTAEVRAKIDYLLSAPPPDPNTQVEVIEP